MNGSGLIAGIEGIGFWAQDLPSWPAARAFIRDHTLAEGAPARPAPRLLPPNERRRAPDSVLLAAEVAAQAATMSTREAATLACVFASAQGDQAITDYMCTTLAQTPAELSPTRFHNSVHNAPVGYWTIATHCHAPSTAVAARQASFGAGLLEAVCQVLAEQQPVLLVCSDTATVGPLHEVAGCSQAFASALVLAPATSAHALARLDMKLTGSRAETPLAEPLASWRAGNASAPALALLALLARDSGRCHLAAASTLGLQIDKESVT